MQKRKDWQIHNIESRTHQEHSGCDLLAQKNSLPGMVHGIWKNDIPRTSRTIAKVTNILKELANTINMK